MKRVNVGALTRFIYPERRKNFPQFIYCGEKYFQLKLMNIQNNSDSFLIHPRYLIISLFVGLIFLLEY